ncbi:MAG TPA: hypothetical protein VII92_14425, partial [Anaerolineae bacterium]
LPIYLRPYNVSPSLAVKRAFVANPSDIPNLAQSSLRDFLSQAGAVLGLQTTLYLFLDQFEEFFTQLDEPTRVQFVNELADCLDDESLNVHWVLALRSEYFGNLANFRPRIRNPFENDFRLNQLTRIEAREVVTEPVARQGITFEDGLIDTILDDLGKEEVAPPQVQLVCSALYEALPADTKVLTRKLYDDQHGAEGILHEHLGRVLHRDLPANQRAIAQNILEALITADGHRDLRTRNRLAEEITLRAVRSDTLDQVLAQLVDSRLLRAEEIDGQLSYELAHDYLLTEIQLDPAVQARKAAQELLDQEAHAYQRFGTLLSDDKFAILVPRRAELALSLDAQTLLQKSERALKRRQRLVLGGVGLVIVLVIIAAISIVTMIGAQTATDTANRSAAVAQSAAATSEARKGAADQALQLLFQRTGIVNTKGTAYDFAFDQEHVWVAGVRLVALDAQTGIVRHEFGSSPGWQAVAYDARRGQLWAAVFASNIVQAIDRTTGAVQMSVRTESPATALAVDADHIWAASGNTLQAINPVAGRIDISVTLPAPASPFPDAVIVISGRVWIA